MSLQRTPEAQHYLTLSDTERLQYISRNTWVDYPVAQKILTKLENLLRYEKDKSRITSILLVGSSSNGKTSLLERFEALHPPYDFHTAEDRPDWLTDDYFEEHSGIGKPVLYILAPNEPNESRLYTNILHALNAPFRERDTISRKQYLVEYYLKLLNIEMLIIDEIHGVLSGSIARQKQTMNAIKNLSNTLKIPIVLSGTKEALRAVSTDTQISSRFRPEYLPKWKMNQEYVNLLATIISMFPLHKESNILNAKAAQYILDMSEGFIGEIFQLLKEAARYAILSGSERITLKEIEACEYSSLKDAHKIINLHDI